MPIHVQNHPYLAVKRKSSQIQKLVKEPKDQTWRWDIVAVRSVKMKDLQKFKEHGPFD